MGRQSRMHKERREARAQHANNTENQDQASRIASLEEQLKNLCEDAVVHRPKDLPPDVHETNLEDILAFESLGSGPSLFEGLQEHGVQLPHPDQLNGKQSAKKCREVLFALAKIRVFLIGFDHMSPCELYRTLWHETLWEGCYMEKRNPGAHTIIDVSHRMSKADWQKFMEEMRSGCTIH